MEGQYGYNHDSGPEKLVNTFEIPEELQSFIELSSKMQSEDATAEVYFDELLSLCDSLFKKDMEFRKIMLEKTPLEHKNSPDNRVEQADAMKDALSAYLMKLETEHAEHEADVSGEEWKKNQF